MEYSEAAVQDKLGQFLRGFQDERNELKYRIQISNLAATQGKSVIVDYPDLEKFDTDLATSVVMQPDLFLKSFDDAALEILNLYNPEHASKIKKELHVRLRELTDKVSLREVTKEQLNTMIMVAGMVTRTSELRPLAVSAAFRCSNRHITMVEQDGPGTILKRPIKCETEGCGEARNFELDEKRTEFVDFQVIKIQEMPEELPPGQLPQSFDVNMMGDLVNNARPGDRIVLTGIVKAESENIGGASRKLFTTRIEANFTEQLGKRPEEQEISREEEEQIKSIAALPGAYDKLVASVAPAIFGHDLHKEAALLLMVGSPQKSLPDGSALRGDINILLVGDPGTAKSEILKYVSRVAPRGLFTSGRGSTAAGLTAAVVKEKNGMMMLEAGATVLADLGVACLHPSSKVVFDGRITMVEDIAKGVIFEKGLSDGKFSEVGDIVGFVPSLNTETLKVETERCTKIRRRWHTGKIINLKLRSGFDIKVTPDHLLLDGNSLVWKEAGQFVPKESLVSPLLLPQQSNSRHVYLWDILQDNTKVSLTDEEKCQLRYLIEQKFESLAEAGRELELPRLASYFQGLQPSLRELKTLTSALGVEGNWKSVCHVYDKSKLFVSEITPELGYICGFIFGDGCVSITKRHATITIHQSLVRSEYIEQLRRCWDKVFQVPFKIGKARIEKSRIRGQNVVSSAVNWHVSRRVLANVYDHLIQNNLAHILSLPEEVLAGFLSGLTDADGCITHKTSKKNRASFSTWNIVYAFSSNRESNLNLLLGLRRFDCLGSYKGSKRGVGVIVVSGRRDCLQLQKAFSLSVKMRKRSELRCYDISGASEKIPSVPGANIVRQLFAQVPRAELIGLGIWSSVYESMNLKRSASVTQMQRIISKYSSFPEESKIALTKLMNRDYFLDDIVGIEESDYEGFVYDLVLQGNNHNFVADGTIVHNCIDEFDKMRVEDRSALHEVMEQQTVSVAKGGIIATLNARTSIFAAANPVDGKYDPYKNILDNVALPIPLMTRFDLIFIIRDEPDPGQDQSVARHILDMRAKSSFPEAPPIEFELLKKYIIYAKKLDPEFTEEASNRLQNYYIKLRREASPDQISVTPRWLEGMIRLSIARARLLLHPRVTDDDALHAVNLVERMLNTVAVDQATKKVDVGVLYNKPVSEKGLREAALDVFKRLSGDSKQPVEDKAFYEEIEKTGKFTREQAEKVFQDMWKSGVIFEVRAHFFKKA